MSKSSNDNSSVLDEKTPPTKIIQKFIKKHAGNFKQEDNDVQVVLEIDTLEDEKIKITREYSTDVFKIFGGKYKLRKGIERKITEIKSKFDDYHNELLGIIIKRIYIYIYIYILIM